MDGQSLMKWENRMKEKSTGERNEENWLEDRRKESKEYAHLRALSITFVTISLLYECKCGCGGGTGAEVSCTACP